MTTAEQSQKPSRLTPAEGGQYLKLIGNDLLGLVFAQALKALLLANHIDETTENSSLFCKEIATALSTKDYRKTKVEYDKFDTVCKKYGITPESSFQFFNAIDRAMTHVRYLHEGIAQLNDDWFAKLESE